MSRTAEKSTEILFKIIELTSVRGDIIDGYKPAISFEPDFGGLTMTVVLRDTHYHLEADSYAALIDKLHQVLCK